MTPAELEALQAIVADERQRTAAQVVALQRELDEIVESGSLSNTDDEHDPDGSTIAYERAKAIALLTQARTTLVELDRALDELRDGSFGVCRACGASIAFERLEALPSTRVCMACAAAAS